MDSFKDGRRPFLSGCAASGRSHREATQLNHVTGVARFPSNQSLFGRASVGRPKGDIKLPKKVGLVSRLPRPHPHPRRGWVYISGTLLSRDGVPISFASLIEETHQAKVVQGWNLRKHLFQEPQADPGGFRT